MPGHGTMTGRIAAVIGAWAQGRPRWTPVPDNDVIAGRLDFTASAGTFRRAKRQLAELGILMAQGGRYYATGTGRQPGEARADGR